jgi:hypothetical protein
VSFIDYQRTGSPTASGVLVVHGSIPSSLYVTVTPSAPRPSSICPVAIAIAGQRYWWIGSHDHYQDCHL